MIFEPCVPHSLLADEGIANRFCTLKAFPVAGATSD